MDTDQLTEDQLTELVIQATEKGKMTWGFIGRFTKPKSNVDTFVAEYKGMTLKYIPTEGGSFSADDVYIDTNILNKLERAIMQSRHPHLNLNKKFPLGVLMPIKDEALKKLAGLLKEDLAK